ncbi:MAG: ANTAR domain-containing protein [Acidimicrobiales bacterium]
MTSPSLSAKSSDASSALDPFGEFAVSVGYKDASAVLSVRGGLNRLTAQELGAILDAVAERHCSVVLDLAELDLMNSWGLEAIATCASRLRRSNGSLTVRSASPAVVRMLEVTRVGDLVDLEHPEPSHPRLAAEESIEMDGVAIGRTPNRLPRQVGMISAIPADADVVDGALRLVVALARATVEGADGVSVSLRRNGELATVAASDLTISDMDDCQYATGEGPCVDASVKGRWFHAESLVSETRWPDFTPRAHDLGINAILATPLLAENTPVGSLNIYSRSAMAFAPNAQELAAMFAREASLILTTAGVVVTDEELSVRIGEALRLRRVVAQAEGVIMEREGVGADQAYGILCDYSRQSNQPFREHAQHVATSTQRTQLAPEPDPPMGGTSG